MQGTVSVLRIAACVAAGKLLLASSLFAEIPDLAFGMLQR